MNKIKKELLTVIDGLDVDDAYSVVKDNSVLFSLFCAENYMPKRVLNRPIIWEGTMNRRYTTEELFKLFEDGLD